MRTDWTIAWNLFLQGDRQGFEALYRQSLSHLYEYGMRKAHDEILVGDCIQDLFVKLWEKKAMLQHVSNPKHYLLISLKNLLINAESRSSKLSEIGGREEFLLNFNLEKQIIEHESDRIRSEKLMNALQQLTDKQREVIYLRYFEELNYEEIAEIMNITVKGLYKLHYRALDSLKDLLKMPKSEIILALYLFRVLIF